MRNIGIRHFIVDRRNTAVLITMCPLNHQSLMFMSCSCLCSVLSWDGECSAISRDAMQDTRDAKHDTVIDEWDEEFDSGKVRFLTCTLYIDVLISYDADLKTIMSFQTNR